MNDIAADKEILENQKQVGVESLRYHPSKVSWSMSKHISQENPLLHRLLVYILIAIIFLAVLYSLVTKVAISIMANGKLDFDANTLTVVNAADLVVDKIFFQDSHAVKKNDLLITGKKQISNEFARELMRQSEVITQQITLEKNRQCGKPCVSKLEQIYASGLSKTAKLEIEGELVEFFKQLSSDLNNYILSIQNLNNEPQSLNSLNLRLKQATQKLQQIRIKKAEQLLAMEVENLNKEIAEINSQINEKKNNTTNQVANARSALQLNLRPLKDRLITYKKNHEIRSPGDGLLKYETLGGEGELLSARTKVFQIIPSQSELIAKIFIQNKDISEIKMNDKVKISIQAIPEREFGAVYGTIKKIAVNPFENQENKALSYEVLVSLEKQTLKSSFGEERNFKLGMLIDAKVITKHRSLFRVGINKLLNIKDEYLGDLF